jgi:carboxymethylenebutenolidase
MNNLDFKAAVEEISAAAAYLRATGSPKVGVTGFCMGGALTLAASQLAGVDCAAPFYGIPAPEIFQVRCVFLRMHFGGLIRPLLLRPCHSPPPMS